MTGILSRAEIEVLLAPFGWPAEPDAEAAGASLTDAPYRLWCQPLSADLSALLQCPVQVQPAATGNDHQAAGLKRERDGQDHPTVWLAISPWGETARLTFDPPLAAALVRRLLGTTADRGSTAPGPLSPGEQRLLLRLSTTLTASITHAWQRLVDVRFEVLREGTRNVPGELTDAGAQDTLRFQVRVGTSGGMLTASLPAAVSQAVQAALLRQDSEPLRSEIRPETADAQPRVQGRIELTARVGTVTVPAEQLLQLAVGDLLTTDIAADAAFAVCVGGEPAFTAAPGVFHGQKAVRLLETAATGIADDPAISAADKA